MDPLTQGVLGASLSQSLCRKQHLVVGGILGFLAAMAPDLDVLIRSQSDPLLFLEYHRQFTHSLLFIPIGSLLCAVVLHPLIAKRWGLVFRQSLFYCALGYSTHALLDACTSYGTQLFWPLSEQRFAWNIVSVIDPAFTLPIVILFIFAVVKNDVRLPCIALLWAFVYPTLGLIQKERAEEAAWQIVAQRQHQVMQLEAKPSFANILLWKVIYTTSDRYYVDAVRVGTEVKIYPGESIETLNLSRDLPWLDPQSQQAKDIERFRQFSNGFVAQDPTNDLRIIDVRYSMVPNQFSALWSVQLTPLVSSNSHAAFVTHRDDSLESRELFWNMLLGVD